MEKRPTNKSVIYDRKKEKEDIGLLFVTKTYSKIPSFV
jgi:hypothetical protein